MGERLVGGMARTTFDYDARGNRVTATTGTGLRASTTTDGVTESYVWDLGAAYPLLLTDADHAYIYGVSGTPVAQIGLDDGSVDYLHTNLIGSVVAKTDAAGTTSAGSDYHLYGVPQQVGECDPVAVVTRFGFAGEYTDPTGYVYLRARYYDPATAQFLTVDPLGLDWLDDVGNWVAGFGDTITFGGTREIRRLINDLAWGSMDDIVDNCSILYQWGGVGGAVASLAALPATGPAATTYAISTGGMAAYRSSESLANGEYTMGVVYALTAIPALSTGSAGLMRGASNVVNHAAPGTIVRSETAWRAVDRFADPAASAAAVLAVPFTAGSILNG